MTSNISSMVIDMRVEIMSSIKRSYDELRQGLRELTLKVEIIEQTHKGQGVQESTHPDITS